MIMEQVENPRTSGTNTICVTTVLLETGMVPMIEPVTELTLELLVVVIDLRCECLMARLEAPPSAKRAGLRPTSTRRSRSRPWAR